MKLWKFVTVTSCSHRFSWPRMDDRGRHYQICLSCGASYEYDWKAMRRTNRLLLTAAQNPTQPKPFRSLPH